MTVAHIEFSEATHHGNLLRNALTKMEDAFTELNELKATMQLMIDGDGTDAVQFDYLTSHFGFTNNTTAKSAWDELNSVLFKLNTDSSVDSVHAALIQVFNKFR